MLQNERGQTATEYTGMLLVVALIVAALATSSVAAGLAGNIEALVCQISGQTCDGSSSTGSEELDQRLAALDPLLNATGGALEDLAEQAEAAIARGDLDTARDLIERLELYRDLIGAGPRGELVSDLVGPSEAEFAELVAQGTIQLDDGASNRRYFRLPAEPGQGILVMDLFIPGSSAGPLKGDDRDFADPLRDPDLGVGDSRVLLIIDRETGRGMIVQSESCTVSAFGGISATSRGRSRSTATSARSRTTAKTTSPAKASTST